MPGLPIGKQVAPVSLRVGGRIGVGSVLDVKADILDIHLAAQAIFEDPNSGGDMREEVRPYVDREGLDLYRVDAQDGPVVVGGRPAPDVTWAINQATGFRWDATTTLDGRTHPPEPAPGEPRTYDMGVIFSPVHVGVTPT